MSNSEKMIVALEKQQLEEAGKYFQYALEEDEEEILLDLGQYLEQIGFLQQANELYQKLLDKYPQLALNLAQIAAEDGEIELAFTYLDEIKIDSPDYVASLLVKADLYQLEGLADVAREKLLEASQLSDEPLIIFGLAEIELELENYKVAAKLYASLPYDEILENTGVSIYQRIGLSYASLGEFEAAIQFLEKAAELDYEDITIFELASLLYEQEEYNRSILYFKQLETINPDFEGYEYVYAKALHADNQLKEALRVVQQGLSRNSFDVKLLLLASQLSYENHDEHLAEKYLIDAKDVADDWEEINLRLSTIYLSQLRYQEVLDLSNSETDNVLTRWNFAKAAQALDDETTLSRYQDLVGDLSENPEFLKDYIDLLRNFGDLKTTKKYVKVYLNLVPDDTEMNEFYQELLDMS